MSLRPFKIPQPRFNLANKTKDRALIILRFRYHYRGQLIRLAYSAGWHIHPAHWDAKTRRARYVRGHEEYREINQTLNRFAEIAESIFVEHNGDVSEADFRAELDYRTGSAERPADFPPDTLFQFIESFIKREQTRANANRNTWKKFPTVFNHLKEFAADQGRQEWNFEDIDWRFKDDFTEWLFSPPREHSTNNASKVINILRQFMAEARRRGLHNNQIPEDPKFKVKRTKTKNQPRLTFEELDALAALDLADNLRLKKVRDLFLVGAYTGLRFSDWFKLRRESVKTRRSKDGREYQYIEVVTKKTDTPVVIPLHPKLKAILEEYAFELPTISAQKFNEYVKEVCALAIPESTFLRRYSEGGQKKSEWTPKYKKVGSHSARRSFASNYWEKGIPARVLMQVTGHATEKQFFEYIDVDQKRLADLFIEMSEKITWD